MRKASFKISKRLQVIASIILGLIAVFVFITNPVGGLGVSSIVAAVPFWGLVAEKTFKELKPDEVAKLDIEDQVKYFNELNLHKAEQMNALKIQMKKDATEAIGIQISKLKDEILSNNKEQLKAIHKAIDAQGIAITKLMTKKSDVPSQKSIEAYLEDRVELLKNARNETVTFKTDVTTASLTGGKITLDVPGVGQLAHMPTKMLGLFAKGSIGDGQGGVVRYVDQLSITRNAATVAESGVKPESAITWIIKTVPLETIADTIPVTNQSLANIPFIASEIRNMLLTNLALRVDAELWSGTGAAPHLNGIYTQADEFVAVASGVTDANIYDLISLMKVKITATSNYSPNYILMNPTDATKYMSLKKDGNNNYIVPPFVDIKNGKVFVSGMEIVETSAITANTMLIGDFSKAIVYTHGSVKIDIGLIDKQFVENMVTIRAEQEMALVVRGVHTNAFGKETSISAGLVTIGT